MVPEQPIFWHQGLFLQPQHFQHLDRYQQSLLYPTQFCLQPYFWGIQNIEINEAALLNRVVELTAFEAIFQDGTWVVLGKNAVLPSRSFADHEAVFIEDETFPLYIGLKHWDRFRPNVASEGEHAPEGIRYQKDIDPVECEDLYEGGPAASMYLLSHRLELFWKDELPDKDEYLLLPVGRLRTKGEEVRFSGRFIPPIFMLQGSPRLLQIAKQIREHIQARCRILETYKPAGSHAYKNMALENLNYLSALKSLNRYLTLLQHFIETPRVHPWTLYAVLRQFIGELSTFSDRMNALGQLRDGTTLLPAYDHLDLETCFNESLQLIGELLEGIVMGAENIISLTRKDDTFSCEIPPETLQQRNIYCLMVRLFADDDQVKDTMVRHVKIGHCDAIPVMIARALSGIPLEYRDIPPLGMARREDSWCFQLDIDHPRWREVTADGRLCLHWDNAPDDSIIELVITRI
ncbi:MAG: type VI secretion system baseplate subunit TssK [Candidatus Electrothrix aestuarii]|uniref:Type VI secretion system baseplate subunit TssK n=1 Tax=Candidatus Electrothrix aestuarii TaxID=3062594 RepID=A0AAU8LV31_9BACT|nr:type VI secretion system baseplate subunit TssK [Candidatus Electrothrix aestuarii]